MNLPRLTLPGLATLNVPSLHTVLCRARILTRAATPDGHSYDKPEPAPSAFRPEEWHQSEDYLYGIDLYNFAYWWECHEIFEGLWHAAGHNTEQGHFLQALIQLAASNLKRFLGNQQAAQNLLNSGLNRLQKTPKLYMGIDVATLTEECLRHRVDPDFCAPPIRLHEQEPM